METVLSDFFNTFDREPLNKRLEKSELALNENQELDFMVINFFKLLKTKFSYLENLPPPRVLYGANSNKGFTDTPSTEACYKSKFLFFFIFLDCFDFKTPAFHFTYENFDAVTGIRIGRTYITTSLQKKFLMIDEDELFNYFESAIYNEAFFLFNIYFLFIEEYKFYQFDLINNKIPISSFIEKLTRKLNDFIKSQYNKNEKNYDYFINPERILINLDEYIILGNFNPKKKLNENKTKILRIEIKDVISPISNKLIGSVLYCDSFLKCHKEILNLTHDILPFKFFYSSHLHFNPKDHYQYEPIKIIKQQNTQVKFSDIHYKGLIFYKEAYNIPYLFPPGKEGGFDSNQMFISLDGKIAVFNDCLILYENSLGIILLTEDNLLEIQYKEETHYSILLIKINDEEKFPLSGIIKNEILLYFYATNSSIKNYKYEMIDFLKIRFKSIFKNLSKLKDDEYDLAIRTIDENKYFSLNYISNSFNFANISDVLLELLEYENFKTKFYDFENQEILPFETYKNLINSTSLEILKSKNNKIIFIYCDIFTNNFYFNFTNGTTNLESIKLLGNTLGFTTDILIPTLDLLGDQIKLFEFYAENLKKQKYNKKANILLVCVYNNFKIKDFIKILSKKYYQNLFTDFEIINFICCLNLEFTKKNKNKSIKNNLLTLSEEIFECVIIEDDLVLPEKIQARTKYINFINEKLQIFNSRSFIKNTKEIKKIYEFSNKNFEFIFNGLIQEKRFLEINPEYDLVNIELEYKLDFEIFKNFSHLIINNPVLYTQEVNFLIKNSNFQDEKKIIQEKDSENKNIVMSDNEFQDELIEEITKLNKKEKEGCIEGIIGKVCFFNDENKYLVKINYKNTQIIKLENEKKNTADNHSLLFIGKNLKNNQEYLKKFIFFLSGKLPEYKKYKTKSDMTEQEIMNLNLLYFERDLPDGWYRDGPVFVDKNDNRVSLHPSKYKLFKF